MRRIGWKDTVLPFFSLFTSAGTLICCALPALLVTLGMGAVTAGLVSALPRIVWLSEHKVWVFLIAGIMLAIATLAMYTQRNAPCPADPGAARMCMRLRRLSFAVTVFSIAVYMTGFFFAFLAGFVF